jgi:CNT family concentrative nucleoside transporter
MEAYNLVSFAGIFVLLGIAWGLSRLVWHDKGILYHGRVLWWGLVLQFVFAAGIFLFPPGSRVFLAINDAAVAVIDCASRGAEFVFGPLALPPGKEGSVGNILAFQALPTIIFFSALVSILYYYRIMPIVIRGFAWLFTRLMRISGAESLCAASNIFVGVESSFTVRPFLQRMTRSELHTILVAGMATVASNVLALYVFMLKDTFPAIAGHLISASFISAPAALIMSKLLMPETEEPETLGTHVRPHFERHENVFDAVIQGANSGMSVIFGIVAMLIAVLGLVALVNLILGGIAHPVNSLFNIDVAWTLKNIFAVVFYPFTLIIGIPPADAVRAAQIIGERVVATEVTSYRHLAEAMAQNAFVHARSPVIITYALCGFAHFASLSIFIGGIAALVPEKRSTLASIGLRALCAATLACLLTACVAGTFYNESSILFSR